MPVPKGTTYRFKRMPDGTMVRLAIYKGKVIEATPYKKGKGGKLMKKLKKKKHGKKMGY